MDEYVRDFVQEGEENVTELNNALLELEREPDNEEAMDRIFRMAHTLKGNAGAMGFDAASDLAHALEDLLDAVRAGEMSVSADLMDDVFAAVDEFETMLDDVRAHGEVRTDPSETIERLRTVEAAATGAPSIAEPSNADVDDALADADDLDEPDHTVYHVRLAVVRDEDVNNAALVIDALEDAFDLLGTVPARGTVDAGETDGRIDAVFGSAVTPDAIEAALEPVEAVDDWIISDVTERLHAIDDADAEAAKAEADEAADDQVPDDPASSIDEADAQEMEVDELLGEFDEYDDLDALVEEMDDVSGFDDLGEAGSFDDLDLGEELEPVDEPAADPLDDGLVGDDDLGLEDDDDVDLGEDELDLAGDDDLDLGDEDLDLGDDDAADLGLEDDDVDLGDDAEADADAESAPAGDEEVEDAAETFAELKQEVDPVGFDELQDELDELEFDEYSDEEEVGFDELLGEDFDEEADEDFFGGDGEVDDATLDDVLVDEDTDVPGFDEAGPADDADSADDDAFATGATDASAPPADADEASADAGDGSAVEADAGEGDAVAADAGIDDAGDDDAVALGPGAGDAVDTDAGEAEEVGSEPAAADSTAPEPSGSEAIDGPDSPDEATSADEPIEAASADEPIEATSADEPIEATSADEPIEATSADDPGEAASADDGDALDAASASSTPDVDDFDDLAGDDADGVTADADAGFDVEDEAVDDETAFETDDDEAFVGDDDEAFAVEDETLASDDETFAGDEDAFATGADAFDAGDALDADDETSAFDDSADGLDASGDFGEPDLAEDEFDTGDVGSGDFGPDAELDLSDPDDAESPGDATPGRYGAGARSEDLDSVEVDEFELDEPGTDTAEAGADVETGDFGADAVGDDESTAGVDYGSVETGGFDEVPEDAQDDAEAVAEDEMDPEAARKIIESTLPTRGDADGGEGELQSVRVDIEQVDRLLNLVEGLVTNRVRLRRSVDEEADPQQLDDDLDDLEDITGELQDTVMDIRLVPLKMVANSLPRVVRDVSREQGKSVDFEMEGEDVEMDRTILDEISDPLVHLVRNAVDHGIESPEEREDAGKSETGNVTLRAERARDRVVVEVSDDGRGLDPDVLREEAVEEGILTEAEAAGLTETEARELVFHPGLSTAGEVTDVSGRGVGMDVVRSTVEDLDGDVEIESELGEGTTIRLVLPVSVAIDDVLFVTSGDEEFGVPTKVVRDIGSAASVVQDGDHEVVRTDDGDEAPVVRLGDALETPGATADGGMLLHVRGEVRDVALHCDNVQGQQEVVVKPFDDVLGGIPGLSGATVLGEGEVVNILDVKTL